MVARLALAKGKTNEELSTHMTSEPQHSVVNDFAPATSHHLSSDTEEVVGNSHSAQVEDV